LLGELDRALDVLGDWANSGGILAKNWLERDPDLDPIRQHPRYRKLIDVINAQLDERQPT
jgi:adenylate cyclase